MCRWTVLVADMGEQDRGTARSTPGQAATGCDMPCSPWQCCWPTWQAQLCEGAAPWKGTGSCGIQSYDCWCPPALGSHVSVSSKRQQSPVSVDQC